MNTTRTYRRIDNTVATHGAHTMPQQRFEHMLATLIQFVFREFLPEVLHPHNGLVKAIRPTDLGIGESSVDVMMNVDKAWHDHSTGKVDALMKRKVQIRTNGVDGAGFDGDVYQRLIVTKAGSA